VNEIDNGTKRLSYDEAVELLIWKESEDRMAALLQLRPRMERSEWLRALCEYWSVCDRIGYHLKELKGELGTKGPLREMMNEEELAAYDALPEEVTVYRGCGAGNREGASWSLDRSVAEKFPFLNRYRVWQPGLITGRVKKKNILACKLDRNEHEIISFSVKEDKEEGVDFLYVNPVNNEPAPGWEEEARKKS
jgi:hypothetical protein